MKAIFFALALSVFSVNVSYAAGCNQNVNPHSFTCAEDTFLSRIFPIVALNPARLKGNWALVSFSPANDRQDPELVPVFNPRNPRIPTGVVNRSDGTRVGVFSLSPGRPRMSNFGRRGQSLTENSGSTSMLDQHTIETKLNGGNAQAGLQCRIFLRNNSEHLLCRWFALAPGQAVLRGFLGFLRAN